LPLFVLQTAAVALGFGLWISALTVKYRDFQNLMAFLVPLWMYATPIIYPTSIVSEKWRFFLALNPMAGIVDTFRYAFFGSGYINGFHILISLMATIIVLASGILVFNKVERTFVDWI
jgi:lipopolysaccharide transport system permease protein